MSKEKKLSTAILQKHLDYVQTECQRCAEHHNYDCTECPHFERCRQAYEQIKSFIESSEVQNGRGKGEKRPQNSQGSEMKAKKLSKEQLSDWLDLWVDAVPRSKQAYKQIKSLIEYADQIEITYANMADEIESSGEPSEAFLDEVKESFQRLYRSGFLQSSVKDLIEKLISHIEERQK